MIQKKIRWALRVGLAILVFVIFAFGFLRNLSPDRFVRPALDDIEAATGMVIRYAHCHIRPAGLVLEEVALDLPGQEQPPVRLARLAVRPSLAGLLAGRLGAPWSLRAEAYSGTLAATLEPTDEKAWSAKIEWTAIDLRKVDGLLKTGQLDGISDGRVIVSSIALAPKSPAQPSMGSWKLAVRDVTTVGLTGGDLKLPQITVSELKSEGTWKGRRATITGLDARGSFGEIQLSGRIVFREPTEKSAISMLLKHTVPEALDPDIQLLMQMLLPPGAVHGGQYRVNGTLGSPSLSPTG